MENYVERDIWGPKNQPSVMREGVRIGFIVGVSLFLLSLVLVPVFFSGDEE